MIMDIIRSHQSLSVPDVMGVAQVEEEEDEEEEEEEEGDNQEDDLESLSSATANDEADDNDNANVDNHSVEEQNNENAGHYVRLHVIVNNSDDDDVLGLGDSDSDDDDDDDDDDDEVDHNGNNDDAAHDHGSNGNESGDGNDANDSNVAVVPADERIIINNNDVTGVSEEINANSHSQIIGENNNPTGGVEANHQNNNDADSESESDNDADIIAFINNHDGTSSDESNDDDHNNSDELVVNDVEHQSVNYEDVLTNMGILSRETTNNNTTVANAGISRNVDFSAGHHGPNYGGGSIFQRHYQQQQQQQQQQSQSEWNNRIASSSMRSSITKTTGSHSVPINAVSPILNAMHNHSNACQINAAATNNNFGSFNISRYEININSARSSSSSTPAVNVVNDFTNSSRSTTSRSYVEHQLRPIIDEAIGDNEPGNFITGSRTSGGSDPPPQQQQRARVPFTTRLYRQIELCMLNRPAVEWNESHEFVSFLRLAAGLGRRIGGANNMPPRTEPGFSEAPPPSSSYRRQSTLPDPPVSQQQQQMRAEPMRLDEPLQRRTEPSSEIASFSRSISESHRQRSTTTRNVLPRSERIETNFSDALICTRPNCSHLPTHRHLATRPRLLARPPSPPLNPVIIQQRSEIRNERSAEPASSNTFAPPTTSNHYERPMTRYYEALSRSAERMEPILPRRPSTSTEDPPPFVRQRTETASTQLINRPENGSFARTTSSSQHHYERPMTRYYEALTRSERMQPISPRRPSTSAEDTPFVHQRTETVSTQLINRHENGSFAPTTSSSSFHRTPTTITTRTRLDDEPSENDGSFAGNTSNSFHQRPTTTTIRSDDRSAERALRRRQPNINRSLPRTPNRIFPQRPTIRYGALPPRSEGSDPILFSRPLTPTDQPSSGTGSFGRTTSSVVSHHQTPPEVRSGVLSMPSSSSLSLLPTEETTPVGTETRPTVIAHRDGLLPVPQRHPLFNDSGIHHFHPYQRPQHAPKVTTTVSTSVISPSDTSGSSSFRPYQPQSPKFTTSQSSAASVVTSSITKFVPPRYSVTPVISASLSQLSVGSNENGLLPSPSVVDSATSVRSTSGSVTSVRSTSGSATSVRSTSGSAISVPSTSGSASTSSEGPQQHLNKRASTETDSKPDRPSKEPRVLAESEYNSDDSANSE